MVHIIFVKNIKSEQIVVALKHHNIYGVFSFHPGSSALAEGCTSLSNLSSDG